MTHLYETGWALPEAGDAYEFFDEMEQAEFESQAESESEWEDSNLGELRPFIHPTLGLGWLGEPSQGELEGVLDGEWESEAEISGKSDSRNPVKNTAKTPFRWICHLLLVFRNPAIPGGVAKLVGTGTLIGPRHVLTAGHNLVSDKFGAAGVEVSEVLATPGRDITSFPFRSSSSEAVFVHDRWRNGFSERFDYGLIKLKDDLSSIKHKTLLRNRPLGFWGSPSEGDGTRFRAVVEPAELEGKKVMIAGYPADKCGYKTLMPQKKGSLCKVPTPAELNNLPQEMRQCVKDLKHATAMFGSEDRIVKAAEGELLIHEVDTCPSMSGAPVWIHSGKDRSLVGIHTGSWGTPVTANRSVRITKTVKEQVIEWMKK